MTGHHDVAASFVVTGASGGIGQAIAQHLSKVGHVVNLDPTPAHNANARVHGLEGDAGDPTAAVAAAELAEEHAPLIGWVNNAVVFQDASLATATADDIASLIAVNLNFAIVGCVTAVQHFLAHSRGGSIVNVSSHQAQRPVRGADTSPLTVSANGSVTASTRPALRHRESSRRRPHPGRRR